MKRIIILTTILTMSLFVHYQSFSQCIYTSCNNSYAINGASTLGSNNNVLGAGSIGLGSDIHISNISTNTIAIGGMLETTGPYSFVIGTGGQAINGRRLVNGHQETLMIGFNSTKPTFFVSKSETNSTFDRTGRIAIGNTTSPLQKLHLKAPLARACSSCFNKLTIK